MEHQVQLCSDAQHLHTRLPGSFPAGAESFAPAETRKLAFNGSDPFRGTGQLPMMLGGAGRLRGELLSHKSVIYNIFYYKLLDLVLLKLLFSTSLKKFQTWNLLGQADSGGR